jgi:hypothetical protein
LIPSDFTGYFSVTRFSTRLISKDQAASTPDMGVYAVAGKNASSRWKSRKALRDCRGSGGLRGFRAPDDGEQPETRRRGD